MYFYTENKSDLLHVVQRISIVYFMYLLFIKCFFYIILLCMKLLVTLTILYIFIT